MTARLSVGIAAAVGPEVAARLAPVVERAGLHALWVNDTPGHDALDVLAAAARVTDRLVLATGVLPVDRRLPADIVDRVAALGLPTDRLVLGIGSGAAAAGALDRVRDALKALRAAPSLSSARVVVGALGPRMRRLGAEASDGLLLSWLTPAVARQQAEETHAVAPRALAALYVRAAADPAASARLDDEARAYAGFPAYAANFARLGIEAGDTVIRPESLADGIAAYRATADEIVLRAIVAEDSAAAYARFVDAVASSTNPA